MFIKKFVYVALVFLFAGLAVDVPAQSTTVFTGGLNAPQKIIYAQRQRVFLVSEAGDSATPNNGRISILTKNGNRFTLIDGLPSGSAPPNAEVSGPSAISLRGNTLYIAISGGNSTMNGPAPGSEIPNPSPNSPIFSSVLELQLSPFALFGNRTNFHLSATDHTRLANGQTIVLGRFWWERSRLRLVANFPDYTPNPRPDVPNNVRTSNPYGLAISDDTLYVADASQNMLRTVDIEDGTIGTLISYPSRMNPTPIGPPFVEPVPDSVRLFNNKLLVTFLTGFPFAAGLADVRQYDLDSGVESQLIGGLSSAIDVLPVNEGGFCSTAYTLEFSTNQLMQTPGRLQRFDTPTGPPTLISDSLISPTSMARDPQSGDLFVTEAFTGRIMRIALN